MSSIFLLIFLLLALLLAIGVFVQNLKILIKIFSRRDEISLMDKSLLLCLVTSGVETDFSIEIENKFLSRCDVSGGDCDQLLDFDARRLLAKQGPFMLKS